MSLTIATARTAVFASLSAMLAIGTVAFATPAAAASGEAVPTATVRYADLDLATPKGVAALDRRLRHAADMVCGTVDPRNLARNAAVSACRQAALAEAAPRRVAALARAQDGTRMAAGGDIKVAAN